MKKRRNIAAALMLSSMMAMSSTAIVGSISASASTLTVKQADGDVSVHSYKAYPVIMGTLSDDKKILTDLSWGDGVDVDKFVGALKAFDSTKFASLPATGAKASDVAKLLSNYENVEGLAKVFNTADVLKTGKALTKSGNTYTADDLANGWYIITDSIDVTKKTPDGDEGITNVRSANLLQIIGDTEAGPKYSIPSLDKKIKVGDQLVSANTANIGDIVEYQIEVPVPNTTGYNKYFYNINDTLSKGLKYEGGLVIKCDNGTESTDDDITLTLDEDGVNSAKTGEYYSIVGGYDENNGTDIKIIFEDCLNTFKGKKGNFIINYKATLNANADITDEGNPNTAKLIYSNDPNVNYEGDTDNKDIPGGEDVTGQTPEVVVKTYTTAIKIKKFDQDGNPLKGAKFKLIATNLNKVIVSAGTTFEVAEDGTYWKLKNGSYTPVAPDDLTSTEAKEQYENDGKKYKKVTASQNATEVTASPKEIEGTVDDSGILTFTGIADGDYTIVESVVPKNYNQAPDVKFKISSNPTIDGASWGSDNEDVVYNTSEFMFEVNVVNHKGTTLPGTGGIGTTIFYIIGGTLVAGAVVMFITKKRMSSSEE